MKCLSVSEVIRCSRDIYIQHVSPEHTPQTDYRSLNYRNQRRRQLRRGDRHIYPLIENNPLDPDLVDVTNLTSANPRRVPPQIESSGCARDSFTSNQFSQSSHEHVVTRNITNRTTVHISSSQSLAPPNSLLGPSQQNINTVTNRTVHSINSECVEVRNRNGEIARTNRTVINVNSTISSQSDTRALIDIKGLASSALNGMHCGKRFCIQKYCKHPKYPCYNSAAITNHNNSINGKTLANSKTNNCTLRPRGNGAACGPSDTDNDSRKTLINSNSSSLHHNSPTVVNKPDITSVNNPVTNNTHKTVKLSKNSSVSLRESLFCTFRADCKCQSCAKLVKSVVVTPVRENITPSILNSNANVKKYKSVHFNNNNDAISHSRKINSHRHKCTCRLCCPSTASNRNTYLSHTSNDKTSNNKSHAANSKLSPGAACNDDNSAHSQNLPCETASNKVSHYRDSPATNTKLINPQHAPGRHTAVFGSSQTDRDLIATMNTKCHAAKPSISLSAPNQRYSLRNNLSKSLINNSSSQNGCMNDKPNSNVNKCLDECLPPKDLSPLPLIYNVNATGTSMQVDG